MHGENPTLSKRLIFDENFSDVSNTQVLHQSKPKPQFFLPNLPNVKSAALE
jgi:hypothetical protein